MIEYHNGFQVFMIFAGFKVPMQTVAQIGNTISYVCRFFGYASFKVAIHACKQLHNLII